MNDDQLDIQELKEITEAQAEDADLDAIEAELQNELMEAIEALLEKKSLLADIQPTSSIVFHAASAAVHVIMAFERGYRLSPSVEG